MLTPITDFGPWSAKREDFASYIGPGFPSGSKVRQFLYMSQSTPGLPMVVGCSADSAMQIYVADAARRRGVAGVVYVPARNVPTEATQWAKALGALVHEVRPGYLTVCRKRARDHARDLGGAIRWDALFALRDAAYQCTNVPTGTRRVVVPVGSGLICSGVLAGLALYHPNPPKVLGVAVSEMADLDAVVKTARKLTDKPLPDIELIRCPKKYGEWEAAVLPDGTPLDPFYAAKSLPYLTDGDCLWVSGVRPLGAMPERCRQALFVLNPGLAQTYLGVGESLKGLPKVSPEDFDPKVLPPLLVPAGGPASILDLLQG